MFFLTCSDKLMYLYRTAAIHETEPGKVVGEPKKDRINSCVLYYCVFDQNSKKY